MRCILRAGPASLGQSGFEAPFGEAAVEVELRQDDSFDVAKGVAVGIKVRRPFILVGVASPPPASERIVMAVYRRELPGGGVRIWCRGHASIPARFVRLRRAATHIRGHGAE